MAHELSITNKVEMAYVGQVPWHGLGQKLSPDSDIDTWKREAGMDWKIYSGDLHVDPVETEIVAWEKFEGKKALYRVLADTTTGKSSDLLQGYNRVLPLSVVSDKYQIVQPGEVIEFFRDIAEQGMMQLETAGCLFNGRQFWALAGSTEQEDLELKRYLLLSSSCDGSTATEARWTATRVVCNNTLSAARQNGTSFRCTHRSEFDPTECKKSLGLGTQWFDQLKKSRDILVARKVGYKGQVRDLYATFSVGEKKLIVGTGRTVPGSNKIYSRTDVAGPLAVATKEYKNGWCGSNFWLALNGFTGYYDHVYGRTQERRVQQSLFGDTANKKTAFLNFLLENV